MVRVVSIVVAVGLWLQGGASMQETQRDTVVAGGLVYVSGLFGTTDEGTYAGTDVQSQTRRVFERLKHVLEAAGSSIEQAVNINVYLKSASDFDAMNVAYRENVSDKPPCRTTIVADLPDGALVQMSAVALPNGAPRETMLPAGWVKSPRPYSYIVRAGDLVFFSGLVSRRGTDDQAVLGPVGLQTKTVLDNAATLLKTAGLTFDDVVSARVFVVDELYYDEMNEVYKKYFTDDPPARATVVAGLMGGDSRVEISLVATTGDKEIVGANLMPTLPVSTAVRAGGRLFVSGVVGDTDANARDLNAQTREVLTRVGRALDGAGMSFNNVVDTTIYMPDVWQFARINDVYREFFPSPPARTTVGSRLLGRNSMIEMMVTAVK